MNSIMIDVETLAISPDAAVPMVAFIPFDLFARNTFQELIGQNDNCFVKLDWADQIQTHSREVSQSTVTWWREQHPDARRIVLKNTTMDMTLSQFKKIILRKLRHWDAENWFVWSRGSHFDIPIMDSLFQDAEMGSFFDYFKYYNVRDTRTAISILGGNGDGTTEVPLLESLPDNFTAHIPAHDAAHEIMILQALIQGNAS